MKCPKLMPHTGLGFIVSNLQTSAEQGAAVLSKQPQALQLRYLQTLTEIAGERSNTIVFPLPVDILGKRQEIKIGNPADGQ